jgi:hypothetical protein
VTSAHTEQFGDMLNVEHDGRRGHAFAVDYTVVGTLKI